MKRFILAMLLVVTSLSASAQFTKGTKYLNTSLSGLDISYMKNHFNFGIDATAGYFFKDALMAYGQLGYSLQNIKGDNNDVNKFVIAAGARYYIRQNGLYLAAALKFDHTFAGTASNNLYISPEVGYCFYLNHYVSIEPALTFDCCLNHFSDATRVGLKLGFGYYF